MKRFDFSSASSGENGTTRFSGIKCPARNCSEGMVPEGGSTEGNEISRKERPKNLAPFRAVQDVINRGLLELIGSPRDGKRNCFLVVVSVVAMPEVEGNLRRNLKEIYGRRGDLGKIDRSEFVSRRNSTTI